jgi:hypothetical protein
LLWVGLFKQDGYLDHVIEAGSGLFQNARDYLEATMPLGGRNRRWGV